MFKENIQNIKNDLNKHHRDRSQLTLIYIQQRLNKSLNSYYNDLTNSVNYISNRKPESVLRKL